MLTDFGFLQLRATLPVSIFISPTLGIDENNNMVQHNPESVHRAIEEYANQAPPLYGEHRFDQLYSDVDPSGYRTPGPTSGTDTPMGYHSRNMSSENISSMNAVTDTDISASALHSRLARLHATRGVQQRSPGEHQDSHHRADSRGQADNTHPDPHLSVSHDYFTYPGGSGSANLTSPVMSGRTSDELDHDHITPSGVATPYIPQSAEFETLSRVPSYTTAVRTTVKPRDSNLPDYEAVMSAPPSPMFPPRSEHQSPIRSGYQSPIRSGDQSPDHAHMSPSDIIPSAARGQAAS